MPRQVAEKKATRLVARAIAVVFTATVFCACAHSEADPGAGSSVSSGVVRAPDFISLAKELQPGVVNVSATVDHAAAEVPRRHASPEGDMLGMPTPPPAAEQSQGSGFIISPDGLIVTNAHVIEGARKVVVRLHDKRELEANVIGKDSQIDIAIIKVAAEKPLAALPFGDSDRLQVGEWVMAVGNPFGLDNSVSSGIVSAKGRHLGQAYDRLIQTDANLNPGSSGGPLINLNGQVVGVSKAIVSQGGGNIGISFATPINLVKEILPQLRASGKVTRGWAGLAIQEMTPGLAESLGLFKADGALVAGVVQRGPAEESGIKVGDVILEFDGTQILDAMDLPLWIARTPIDRTVRLKVLRAGAQMDVRLKVRAMPETTPQTGNSRTG